MRSPRYRAKALSAALSLAITCTGVAALGGGAVILATSAAQASNTLPTCPFWTNATPPVRQVSPFTPPPSLAGKYSLAGRPAAPKFVKGSLAHSVVTITFDAVPGAGSYRLWRNAIAVQWVQATGAATYTVTDPDPCQGAFYTLVANPGGTTGTEGQLSHPLRLGPHGAVKPWHTPTGSTIHMLVTSYNDVGDTAAGYPTKQGMCAVDPRVVPWGTRFWVPDYGWCYAGDIGTWIQDDTVDVWLPGSEASGWGVQDRTITINKQGN
jgi:3D (Asp-Asp-Asp) domain-containing protein